MVGCDTDTTFIAFEDLTYHFWAVLGIGKLCGFSSGGKLLTVINVQSAAEIIIHYASVLLSAIIGWFFD